MTRICLRDVLSVTQAEIDELILRLAILAGRADTHREPRIVPGGHNGFLPSNRQRFLTAIDCLRDLPSHLFDPGDPRELAYNLQMSLNCDEDSGKVSQSPAPATAAVEETPEQTKCPGCGLFPVFGRCVSSKCIDAYQAAMDRKTLLDRLNGMLNLHVITIEEHNALLREHDAKTGG